jgi:hypothetical protein
MEFSWQEVDGGAISCWTGRGTSKIESPISGFDAGVKSGLAAGGKLRRVFDGGGRTSVYGGVKSGPAVEGNIWLHLFTPKVKIADERNQKLKGANRGSDGSEKWNIMPKKIPSSYPPHQQQQWRHISRTLGTRSFEEGRSVTYLGYVTKTLLKLYLCSSLKE